MSDSVTRRDFVAAAAASTVLAFSAATARGSAIAPASRVHKLEELAWPQIAAFNRDRTMFILPVGMIEQHGPHLPVGADTLGVSYEAERAAQRVSRALADWNIVMMPVLNYGSAGANLVGGMLVHPGTIAIRQSTLRAVVADLGGQVAENGFKWIFVLNGHGAPPHGIALNQACDFISQTFAVTMLHVSGLFMGDAAIQAAGRRLHARHFTAAELASFGMDVHAGVSETSGMLAVRPDLVKASYKTLPGRAAQTHEELRRIATTPGWQGYFSAPARASAAHGRGIEQWWINGLADIILRAVRGENMFAHARVPDTIPPAVSAPIEKALASEAAFDARLQAWLAQRK